MKRRERELIAFLLGDAAPAPSTRGWLATIEGRRELAAYRRTLWALDRLLGAAKALGRTHTRGAFMARSARSVRCTVMGTPIGRVLVASTESGLVRVSFKQSESSFVAELERVLGVDTVHWVAELGPVTKQLERYFAGQCNKFDLPVDLKRLTSFQRRVLGATRRIPIGRVVSYGEIARRIGQPKASRAVGQALGQNPVPIVIPCHRVISAGGGLGGYTGGLDIKKRLLAIEGVKIA